MPKLALPGENPEINACDVATSLSAAWTKAKKGPYEADVRRHIVMCREQGDEAGAQAFLPLGRDAWWVPLYTDPSPATAAPLLAATNDEDRQDSWAWSSNRGATLERLLDVAKLVPESRAAALDRFVERAQALIEVTDAEGKNYRDCLKIPFGLLARESLSHARALVDAQPKLLECELHDRRAGVCGYIAELVRADFDAGLASAASLSNYQLYALADEELYGLEFSAEQWVALVTAASAAVDEHGLDELFDELAYNMLRNWRPATKQLALALYEARSAPNEAQLRLLVELGRHDEARALVEKLPEHANTPQRLSEERFILGLDSLDETLGRLVHGNRVDQIRGLQAATRMLLEHAPEDEAGLTKLNAMRTKLIELGPEHPQYPGPWGGLAANEHVFRLRAIGPEGEGYAAAFAELVSSIKSNKADRRSYIAEASADGLLDFDVLGAVKLAKMKAAQNRCDIAPRMSRAFLPLDPGGALTVLCMLCPKQPHWPSELLEGTLDVLRALYL